MENTKHTDGPWDLFQKHTPDDGTGYGFFYHKIIAGTGCSTGGFTLSGIISPSDAALIKAAPELLEALELALEYIQSCPDQLSASGQVAREAARAAIAKAKGDEA